MNSDRKIQAIIWDYDGTLVDSRLKNLNVTRQIIEKATGKRYDVFSALINVANFEKAHLQSKNWRDFYSREFGFTQEETNKFGSWWSEFQLEDQTPVKIYPGVYDLIYSLKQYTHAIVSQNSRNNILNFLSNNNLQEVFREVVGFEEINIERQKPYPDGLLKCINNLNLKEPGTIFYIGDHETDAQLVYNINQHFGNGESYLKALSIGAFYIFPTDTTTWKYKPDYEAPFLNDIVNIVDNY